MDILATRRYSKTRQYLISTLLVVITAVLCYFSVEIIGFRTVALILLLIVSINAILFEIFPVMLSAFLSAIIWNFFFIPPLLTLNIRTPEDALMFLMYFVIAFINAVLTYKIRESEQKARDREEDAKIIQLYNTLLNSLSHELKTPIAAILGAVDIIKDPETQLPEASKQEVYNQIEIAGLRLNKQVKNLLNMSRLEAGAIQPKTDWCDINEVIFSVINENIEESPVHDIKYEADDSLPLFKLDSGLIEQILYNLVQNAIQYTPPQSTIIIEAEAKKDNFLLMVSDNGEGFPEEEIESVFNKFYRLNSSVAGGTGLGLSIVKGFVEAMGGIIILENIPDGGAKFTIQIPCELTYLNDLEDE